MAARESSKSLPVSAAKRSEFGNRIRKIRTERKLTLEKVSKLTRIPASTLSRVENGIIETTFSRVIAIANGLEIPIASLIGADEAPLHPGRRAITRRVPGGTKTRTSRRIKFEVLCEDVTSKHSVFWRVTVNCASLEQYGALSSHPGEEFLMVLSGDLELHCEAYKPVVLHAGDCTFFDGLVGHAYLKKGKNPAVLLMVNSIDSTIP